MEKLSIVSNNPNYLAKVVRLTNIRRHSNADKLQCVSVNHSNVITGLFAKEGDLYIFFPLECAINGDYLKWSNSYSNPELNRDKSRKGFFNNHGRVKAIKLRGEKSEGYIVPAEDIINWFNESYSGGKLDISDFPENKEFDHILNIKFVEKYVNLEQLRKIAIENNALKNKNKKVKRESKLVENQFRVAEDTKHLKREIDKINPYDIITISYKLHGSNCSIGRVLCKKPLKWYEKLAKLAGLNIKDVDYDIIFASRTVIKNQYADVKKQGYYDSNIWEAIANKYKDAIKDGIVLYGEIVGYTASGKYIQKGYDYRCEPNTCEAYFYRGTIVNNKGEVFEMTTPQLQRYCNKMGLKIAPVFYYGPAKDWDRTIDVQNHWRENFLAKLIEKYNEKDCFMCENKVPEEGIVISKEGDYFEAYKLKSHAFLCRESEEIDRGEVNIEDIEANISNI